MLYKIRPKMLLHCEFDFQLRYTTSDQRKEVMARVFLFIITSILIFDTLFTASVARSYPMMKDVLSVRKRPFCNAFTGCGRKRSRDTNDLQVLETFRRMQMDRVPLTEIEPALDELSQLAANAELWGSIRDEILKRKY